MKILEDICRISVRFSEIDSMRRAWHGAFVAYMEDGRESFGRHWPGIGYADMQEAGIYAPVYDLHIRYLAPLKLNEGVVIHTRYVYHPGARLDYAYQLYREGSDCLCAEGETTQLFIDADGELLTEKPAYYKAWQEKYLQIADMTEG
ncbi:thioesterase family protein [gut metagenome]|uniref:Thioesterase family protein n=1 Tax=gut metagenome TaxID=749906 RepID=J9FS20_9ZZZZ